MVVRLARLPVAQSNILLEARSIARISGAVRLQILRIASHALISLGQLKGSVRACAMLIVGACACWSCACSAGRDCWEWHAHDQQAGTAQLHAWTGLTQASACMLQFGTAHAWSASSGCRLALQLFAGQLRCWSCGAMLTKPVLEMRRAGKHSISTTGCSPPPTVTAAPWFEKRSTRASGM